MKEDTCKERIDKMFLGRIKDVKTILNADDPIEKLNESALYLSKTAKTVIYKLELSGGPQDYFEFEYDPENDVLLGVEYFFFDWFDAAKKVIKEDSEEFKLLEQLFELIKGE